MSSVSFFVFLRSIALLANPVERLSEDCFWFVYLYLFQTCFWLS